MKYDPTRQALYNPETDDPVADFRIDWRRDAICAELSRLVYYRFEADDRPRLESALTGAGFTSPGYFDGGKTGAQAIGAVGAGGVRFVVFRGTQPDSVSDFFTNADFKLQPWPGGGRAHSGFAAAFDPVRERIRDWLGRTGGGTLVATGHSLGAALASVMAAEEEEAELVTFGSPRVGDQAFADRFGGRVARRYVDCTDVVAGVPPGILSYAHLGALHYIDRFGVVRSTEPTAAEIGADRAAASRFYLRAYAWKVWRNAALRSFADHAPINYVSALLGRRDPAT